jgi:hypothetical protein
MHQCAHACMPAVVACVDPHRIIAGIFDTIGKFVQKKATKIVILNLSDIKPVPIGTAAVMAFLWDPEPFLSAPPDEMEGKFLRQWLTRQYGAAALDDGRLQKVVQDYFNMPWLTKPSSQGKWLGEVRFCTASLATTAPRV